MKPWLISLYDRRTSKAWQVVLFTSGYCGNILSLHFVKRIWFPTFPQIIKTLIKLTHKPLYHFWLFTIRISCFLHWVNNIFSAQAKSLRATSLGRESAGKASVHQVSRLQSSPHPSPSSAASGLKRSDIRKLVRSLISVFICSPYQIFCDLFQLSNEL